MSHHEIDIRERAVGREDSFPILEAFERRAVLSGRKMNYVDVDENRIGNHIC